MAVLCFWPCYVLPDNIHMPVVFVFRVGSAGLVRYGCFPHGCIVLLALLCHA